MLSIATLYAGNVKLNNNINLCKTKGAKSCYDIGDKYANGKDGYAKDPFKANIFFFKAGDNSYLDSGRRVTQFKKLKEHYSAIDIFKQYDNLCNIGNGTICTYIGLMYARGIGANQSRSISKKFYTKACDKNDGEGCTNLGLIYKRDRREQSNIKAKKLFKKACSNNNNLGCSMYKRMQKKVKY